jgi:D-alanyl-D-alanine dipeptidase
MIARMRRSLLILFWALTAVAGAAELRDEIPAQCRQMLLVTTANWNAPRGEAQRYERTGAGAGWQQMGEAGEVLLGEHGLAWGRGLHTTPSDAARRKREGDRCAPAGIFRLTTAFGRRPATQLAITSFPYREIHAGTEAVDDPASRFYNRIVDRTHVRKPDWKSSERMAEIADYTLGVVVAHNPQNTPGAGSCIFLHEWRGSRTGTAGCTVLPPAQLLELVRWLDASKSPVLVQLPRSELPESFPQLLR